MRGLHSYTSPCACADMLLFSMTYKGLQICQIPRGSPGSGHLCAKRVNLGHLGGRAAAVHPFQSPVRARKHQTVVQTAGA